MTKLNLRGQVFSFETIISIILVLILIVNVNFSINKNYTDLIIIQQENDLIKIWSYNNTNTDELITDAKKFFNYFKIEVNGKIIFDNLNELNGKNCVTREEEINDLFFQFKKIKLNVCY
ncbi:MAG: hypothetical protein PHQ98_00660 [Candidatus ainarchaeum sp.]|nr:hypothetical protein [Candidatus ainarchaeum sp.]